jgi:hypothetical protein
VGKISFYSIVLRKTGENGKIIYGEKRFCGFAKVKYGKNGKNCSALNI